jgi:hypothetical protein
LFGEVLDYRRGFGQYHYQGHVLVEVGRQRGPPLARQMSRIGFVRNLFLSCVRSVKLRRWTYCE